MVNDDVNILPRKLCVNGHLFFVPACLLFAVKNQEIAFIGTKFLN